MPSLKYFLIPVLLLPLLGAVDATPIIQNSNFDFLPANHALRGPNHVNINKTNCPSWTPTDNPGNVPFTPIAAELKGGIFDLPDCKTHLQIQTDHGIHDLFQEITISTSGTYVLSMDAALRNDNINTDGTVFIELWRGSVKNFQAGAPLKADSFVSPDLTVDPQTHTFTYKFLPAGKYTVHVGGANAKAGQMYQAGIANVKLTLKRAMAHPGDDDRLIPI